MYLYQELATRAGQGNPVRVGLIGAGKFGSMFLSQVPTTPGLEVRSLPISIRRAHWSLARPSVGQMT